MFLQSFPLRQAHLKRRSRATAAQLSAQSSERPAAPPPRSGPLLSLAWLVSRLLPATPAGAGPDSRRSPRRPRAAHAPLPRPPHLRHRRKVPASGERRRPAALGPDSEQLPARPGSAPRTPPRPGSSSAEGVRGRGRSSPRLPHPRAALSASAAAAAARPLAAARRPARPLASGPPHPRNLASFRAPSRSPPKLSAKMAAPELAGRAAT
ncbi:translation initiation factor IF-2-like [Cricetulus griseus]|uniref:Translation initiation factor IF-2-like n=1 Tax=Cricetulus griseus TaxID=10029 RepID=A0A9J7K8H5_CRIGR|nr:translation initiation factor IF-2-like [Cricetulus griseus]